MIKSINNSINEAANRLLDQDVNSIMFYHKKEVGKQLAEERGYKNDAADCFIEGFCGVYIKISNPKARNGLKQYKEGKALLQNSAIKKELNKARDSFIQQCGSYNTSYSY